MDCGSSDESAPADTRVDVLNTELVEPMAAVDLPVAILSSAPLAAATSSEPPVVDVELRGPAEVSNILCTLANASMEMNDQAANRCDGPTNAQIRHLQERLKQALQELNAARALLSLHDIMHKSSFSSLLEDHADVLRDHQLSAVQELELCDHQQLACDAPDQLKQHSSANIGSQRDELQLEKQQLQVDADFLEDVGALPESASQNDVSISADDASVPSRPESTSENRSCQQVTGALGSMPLDDHLVDGPLAGDTILATASAITPGQFALDRVFAATVASTSQPLLSETIDARERERLEEELSMAKALLMLNNVTLSMDFDEDDQRGAPRPLATVLKGNRQLIKLLITLKQKVALLNQQYLLLRGDMLYLNHEMQVCRHWILQSFRMAMQHQSQEHSSLQTRFERLSKVLN